MTTERWIRRRLGFLLVFSLVLGALSACSGGHSASSTPTSFAPTTHMSASTKTDTSTTNTTEASATTLSPVAQLVKKRWLAYWTFVDSATANPNPFDPKLDDYTIGPAFSGLQGVLEQRVKDGIVVRYSSGPDKHNPRVVDVNDKGATVRDCWEDRAVQVKRATGKVVDDRIGTLLLNGTMVLAGGQWKTFRYEIVQKWSTTLEESGCRA